MPLSNSGSNLDLGLGQPVGMARARPAGLESVGREALRPPGPGKCASAASRTLIRGSSMLAWWLQWPRRALLPIAIGPPGQRLKVFTPRLLHSLAGRLARRRPTEGGRLLLGNLGHAYVGGSRKHPGFARRSAGSVRTASRRSIEAGRSLAGRGRTRFRSTEGQPSMANDDTLLTMIPALQKETVGRPGAHPIAQIGDLLA
jgi:hypothetical protein